VPLLNVVAGVDANFLVTDATCTTTGSVKVSPFGGTAPYIVKLYDAAGTTLLATSTSIPADGSFTFSSLTAATYTIKLSDANNCPTPVIRTREVKAPDAIATPAATVTQPTCATATGTVTITSPVAGITYTLKQGGVTKYTDASGVFSLVIAGTYNLSASNGTCSATGSVVNNCDGSSDLTASNYTGSLSWSNGAITASIHVTNAATYTVTQTSAAGCTSPAGSGTSAPRTTPSAPTVSVVNNCDGSSDLTASNYTGSLLWSNGATTASIHVTNAATYTVTQTSANGCTSLAGSGTSAPRTTPPAPTVSVVNNCDGSSDLTASNYTGSLSWSNGATTASIHVTNAATYTVTQTNANGCTSLAGSGTSAPKTTPGAPSICVVQPSLCGPATGSITVLSPTGDGYQYSINGGSSWQAETLFGNLAAGSNPSIIVQNANGCISSAATCDGASVCAPQNTQNALQSSVSSSTQTYIAPEQQTTTVKVYPNPFNSKVRFSIESPVSGKASLDIYNIAGQKLNTVYQGYLFAGRKQVIDYNAPSTNNGTLIYTLKIGGKQVNGKVVQVK